MSLSFKEKELVSISASIASGCKPCTSYHFNKTQEAGASDEEVRQAVADAICVCNSAKEIMENLAHKHLGITSENVSDDCGCSANTTRIKELVSIAAAFAVNCTLNLQKHIATSRTTGIAENEIESVLNIARSIKEKAASHVDQIGKRIGKTVSSREKSEDLEGCGCNNESSESAYNLTEQTDVAAQGICGFSGDC